jgi:hypothetical protein
MAEENPYLAEIQKRSHGSNPYAAELQKRQLSSGLKPTSMSQGSLIPHDASLTEAPPMTRMMMSLPKPIEGAVDNLGKIAGVADEFGGNPYGVETELPKAAIGLSMRESPTAMSMNLGGRQVPLTAAEVTKSPVYSAIEYLMSKIPFSSGKMNQFNDVRNAALGEYRDSILASSGKKSEMETAGAQAKETIQSFLDKKNAKRVADLSEKRGSILPSGIEPPIEAGQGLQDKVAAAKESARKESSSLYLEAAKNMPDQLKVFPADQLRAKAKEILETKGGSPSTIPSNVESHLKEILNSPQGLSWDKMHSLQSDYGGLAQKEKIAGKGFQSPEGAVWNDLKRAARGDMEKAANRVGGEFLEKYNFAKSFYKDYRTNFDNDAIRKFIRAKPDQVFDSFIRRGSIDDINKLSKIISPQDMEPMRKLMIQDIVGGAKDAVPSSTEIARKLDQYKYKMGAVLKPEQIAQVKKFAKTGDLPQFVQSELEKNIAAIAKRTPTAISDAVMRGDPTISRTIKKIVGERGWQPYRREFMEKIIGESGADLLTSNKMSKTMSSIPPEFRRLFVSDADVKGMEQVIDAKKKFETATASFGNASGTAKNIIFWEMGKAVFTNPTTGVPMILFPGQMAKFYLSPVGRRLLIDGLTATEVNAAQRFARMSAYALNAKREYHDEERIRLGLKPDFMK